MLQEKSAKILMVYVEPTSYILGLINSLENLRKNQIQVIFLENNKSQQWNLSLDPQWIVLPENLTSKIGFIIRLLLKNRYDMIHIAGWGHFIFLLLIMISKMIRLPVVVESDTPVQHHVKLSKRIFKRFFYPKLFKLINLFFPGGTRQANYLKRYGVDSNSIIPVQMTVDVTGIKNYVETLTTADQKLFRKRYGINENDIVFLFVGRLVAHKGLADLIKVFSCIDNKNIKLLIVGEGDMQKLVETSATSIKSIHYAGRLSDQQLIQAYYAADVFVLPSHFEPWGLVVNEAMALSKPVVVSDRVGCIDDLVVHLKNGLIIKPGNMIELRNAIEYMASHPQERFRMGMESARIIADWTLENEAQKISEAWGRLLCV